MNTVHTPSLRKQGAQPARITWGDIGRSIVIGILIGWLLVSIHNPEHERFDFTVTQASFHTNDLLG